jgi:hypothetical protein
VDNSGTNIVTLPNPTSIANFLILSFWIISDDATIVPNPVIDSFGNAWAFLITSTLFVAGSDNTTPAYMSAGIAYAMIIEGGADHSATLSFPVPGSTNQVNFVTISEWNGIAGAGESISAAVSVPATPQAPVSVTVGPITPSSNGELIYCTFVSAQVIFINLSTGGALNPVPGAGFTLIESNFEPDIGYGDEYLVQDAAAPVSGTWGAGGQVNGYGDPTGYLALVVSFSSNGPPASGALMERSFACNGAFESTSAYGDVLKSLALSMAGFVVPPGDCWRIYAGSYVPPTVTLEDADCRAAIKGDFRLSARDTCNGVKGQYIPEFLPINPLGPLSSSPANSAWKKTDFPPVQRVNYIEEDGGVILWKDIQLDFTISLWMAQRIARIVLERLRRQVTVSLPAKLTGLALLAADTIEFLHARWSTATPPPPTSFQISHTALRMESQADGVPGFGVDLLLRQTDAEVYEFAPPTSPTAFGDYSSYGQLGYSTEGEE